MPMPLLLLLHWLTHNRSCLNVSLHLLRMCLCLVT